LMTRDGSQIKMRDSLYTTPIPISGVFSWTEDTYRNAGNPKIKIIERLE
jgi:hypothetical protein